LGHWPNRALVTLSHARIPIPHAQKLHPASGVEFFIQRFLAHIHSPIWLATIDNYRTENFAIAFGIWSLMFAVCPPSLITESNAIL
jgi:hypothetical protein